MWPKPRLAVSLGSQAITSCTAHHRAMSGALLDRDVALDSRLAPRMPNLALNRTHRMRRLALRSASFPGKPCIGVFFRL